MSSISFSPRAKHAENLGGVVFTAHRDGRHFQCLVSPDVLLDGDEAETPEAQLKAFAARRAQIQAAVMRKIGAGAVEADGSVVVSRLDLE